jgi:hypothetical protein
VYNFTDFSAYLVFVINTGGLLPLSESQAVNDDGAVSRLNSMFNSVQAPLLCVYKYTVAGVGDSFDWRAEFLLTGRCAGRQSCNQVTKAKSQASLKSQSPSLKSSRKS